MTVVEIVMPAGNKRPRANACAPDHKRRTVMIVRRTEAAEETRLISAFGRNLKFHENSISINYLALCRNSEFYKKSMVKRIFMNFHEFCRIWSAGVPNHIPGKPTLRARQPASRRTLA